MDPDPHRDFWLEIDPHKQCGRNTDLNIMILNLTIKENGLYIFMSKLQHSPALQQQYTDSLSHCKQH
jgi:hypothetical protein